MNLAQYLLLRLEMYLRFLRPKWMELRYLVLQFLVLSRAKQRAGLFHLLLLKVSEVVPLFLMQAVPLSP